MPSNERYTPQQVSEAIEKAGGILAAAARVLGCSRKTVYGYMDRHPECREAYDNANEVVMDEAEGRLIRLLRDEKHKDHFQALRFYLRTKARTRGYVERQEMDVTSKGESVNRTWIIVDPPEPDDNE